MQTNPNLFDPGLLVRLDVLRVFHSQFFSAACCCFICRFVWLIFFIFFNNVCFSLPVTFQSSVLIFPELQFHFLNLCLFYLCFLPLSLLSSPSLVFSFIPCLYDSLLLIFIFPYLSPSLHLLFFFLSSPRVTLDPSKRQSSNKSMSGCTLPQGTKTVSKSSFPMFSGCFCLLDCLPAYQCPVIPSPPHPLSVTG